MFRCSWVIVAGLTIVATAPAQPLAGRFRWQPGQVLTYRVQHETSAAAVVNGKKEDTSSKVGNVKRWEVLEVDAAGIATVQLSLTSLRLETTTPSGETMVYDSADPDKSTPQL